MSADSFSRGTRDNGLRCSGYQPVADLDPRIADAMLVTLRAAGIAAYAAPTPAATGGYGERQFPSLPTDRLWADGEQLDRARELLVEQTTEPADIVAAGGAPTPLPEPDALAPAPGPAVDFDAAWQQVLTSLRSPSVRESDPRWPEAESVAPGEDVDFDGADFDADLDDADDSFDPADHEHYVPPPPPPLPRLRSVTVGAVLAIGLGVLALAFDIEGGSLRIPAFMAIVGGAISLVWNMRQGPPADSGWDDGAVV
ncbi:MAG: hypothetical protein JO079_00170 [Frankiaceae bacterium]|nr:hypothetical protein [Frankiaceae bacterium]MBV9369600.1 hypothetical protein [Frankiales bacterium]